ncbi:MAG: pantoate--beta-alanine ligase [Flavobacteriaceae bacterium]
MQVINTRKALISILSTFGKDQKLGLVPTMGALHRGHMALVERALLENERVVVTIFVNPTQFNNKNDLKKYPKTLEADVRLISQVSEKIIVFAPTISEMYNNDVNAKTYQFDGLEKVMEGAFREGHFNGVGTIVESLFRLVEPDRAYFGEKDYQQLLIIKKLVHKLAIPIEIVGCPIIREANGLALSSRNERLPKTLREDAGFIYATLKTAKKHFGTKSADKVRQWVTQQFNKRSGFKLEYIEITDAETLLPLKRKQKNKKYRAFVAVYAGEVRLIDNIAL